MKDQWKQGLQWGAVAAVARWIAPYLVTLFYTAGDTPTSFRLCEVLCAAVAVPVFALIVLTWSRFSRAILLVIASVILWRSDWEPLGHSATASFAITRFVFWQHAEVIRFLPLLFLTPSLPRLTVAFALLGRWRDAARTLAGFRWVPVAVGVFFLGRLVNGVGQSFYGESLDNVSPAILRWDTDRLVVAIAPFVALLVVAALPSRRPHLTARFES